MPIANKYLFLDFMLRLFVTWVLR